jgi:hypothetical protein
MIGDALTSLSLPTIELLPHDDVVPTTPGLPEESSNVVPLRPRARADNRLN